MRVGKSRRNAVAGFGFGLGFGAREGGVGREEGVVTTALSKSKVSFSHALGPID